MMRRWQDYSNLLLGIWLFASPWVLGYTATVAAANAHVMGIVIVMVALLAAHVPKAWEEAINTVSGMWLVLSPFLLGFSHMSRVSLHAVVIGIMVTAFATWAMVNGEEFKRCGRPHAG